MLPTPKIVLLMVAFGVLSLLSLNASAQQSSKRLILKDGSYQPAVRWEIKGDRVRYLSAERYEWEELPKSLVDWPATAKYEQELQSGAAAENLKLHSEADADLKTEEAKSPTIAPGIRLPDTGGVYLLDAYNSRSELVELVQNGSEVRKNTGRNILRATINPLASAKQSFELKGARARVQSHLQEPLLYVDISDTGGSGDNSASADNNAAKSSTTREPAVDAADRFRIVRVEQKKDSRVVGNLKIAFYGKVSQEGKWVGTRVEPVASSEWLRVTPLSALAPGEYALIEMLGKNQMNLYVWDFGVDPSAPRNPTAWSPVQPKPAPAGTNDSPVLEQRPKLRR